MFKIKMILLAFALLTVALSTGLKYETKALDFNTVYSENLQGSEMKFYSIPIDSNLKQSDLLIDARISSKNRDLLFKSPLVLVSLVRIITYALFFTRNLSQTQTSPHNGYVDNSD